MKTTRQPAAKAVPMAPRAAISNFIITVVILFFMLLLGMLLKARYRLPSENKEGGTAENTIPRAIPVATPVQAETVHEARAYMVVDGWWLMPHPELVVSRANEADTLRIRGGPKEDVFVLYFVDAAEATLTRPRRLREQAEFFHKAPQEKVVETGGKALAWVTNLLKTRPFIVYTRWGKVPESERFYAFIRVEMENGVQQDLGELLVRRGFAAPSGQQTKPLPPDMPAAEKYVAALGKALALAKQDMDGAWSITR